MCALRTVLQKALCPFMVQSTTEDEVVLEAIRVTAAIIAVEPIRDNLLIPPWGSRAGGGGGRQGLRPKGSVAIQLLVFFVVVVVQLVGWLCVMLCYAVMLCYMTNSSSLPFFTVFIILWPISFYVSSWKHCFHNTVSLLLLQVRFFVYYLPLSV